MDAAVGEILLVLALIFVNGLFALAEIAVVSARQARLQASAEEGDDGARVALQLAEDPTHFLSTVQVGITLVGILAGAVGGGTLAEALGEWLGQVPWLAPYSEALALGVVVTLITYFSLVIGELIPKRLGLNNPEGVAARVARPMYFLSRAMLPVVRLLSGSTNLGLRLMGVAETDEPAVTEEEVRVLIEQGTKFGVFEAAEQDMVEGVFRLGERSVDALMTPHTELVWLDLDEPYPRLLQTVLENDHTRFPVGRGSLDNVQGILLARDLLVHDRCEERGDVMALLRPPLFIPAGTPALRALEQLKSVSGHVALVIDEFGGVLGMVTSYDILKAIVGAFNVPGENGKLQIVRREDGSWLLDGLLQIDEFKVLFELKQLPDEERAGYQTLGGFVMSQLGSIPQPGQHFLCAGLRFEVLDMDGRRVDKVLVAPVDDQEAKGV